MPHGDDKNIGERKPRTLPSPMKVALGVALALAVVFSARGQESVAEAARLARQQKISSANRHKILTNADLASFDAGRSASSFDVAASSESAQAATPADPNPALPSTCDNPQADQLRVDLQAAQQQLDQLRRELQQDSPVVSNNDLDRRYFVPGNSGLAIGTPPLLDNEPPAPMRVTEVEFQERIDTLQKALRLACQSPEAARIQIAIDQAEDQLNLRQRQFALEQEDYSSKPLTEQLGGDPLAAERQQIQELQAQIDSLKAELAVLLPAQIQK